MTAAFRPTSSGLYVAHIPTEHLSDSCLSLLMRASTVSNSKRDHLGSHLDRRTGFVGGTSWGLIFDFYEGETFEQSRGMVFKARSESTIWADSGLR